MWGRIGGLRLRATRDPLEYTAKARETFLGGFLKAVDPNGELPVEEREARARAMRRAHMSRLAMASARARAKNKHKGSPAEAA